MTAVADRVDVQPPSACIRAGTLRPRARFTSREVRVVGEPCPAGRAAGNVVGSLAGEGGKSRMITVSDRQAVAIIVAYSFAQSVRR